MIVKAELRNINGQIADVYIDGVCVASQWYLSVMPEEFKPQELNIQELTLLKNSFSTDDILKLKEAGLI